MIPVHLLAPEFAVTGTALLILLLSFLTPRRHQIAGSITALGLLLAMFLEMGSMGHSATLLMLQIDPITRLFSLIFILGTFLVTLLTVDTFEECPPEVYFFLLTGLLGMMILAKSTHLVLTFLALELLSFSLFVLVTLVRTPKAVHAGVKFFLVGAFSSSFLLMGLALLLAAGGNLSYETVFHASRTPLGLLGLIFLLVGFGFKLLYVPFHFWAPDVFEGAPSAIVAYVASAPKAAGIAILIPILTRGFAPYLPIWASTFTTLAFLTMIAGNLAALRERNVKRMLAFSTVAHAGYLLVGFATHTPAAYASLFLYLLIYVVMTIGAFAGIVALQEDATLDDLKGLATQSPLLAFLTSLFFLSLAGIPPTGGFVAKLYLFKAAIQGGQGGLAFFAFLNSVVSAYYYLQVPAALYMHTPAGPTHRLPEKPMLSSALWIGLVLVFYLGLFPDSVYWVIQNLFR